MNVNGEPGLERCAPCPADPAVVVQRIYPQLLAMAKAISGGSDSEDLAQQALVEVLVRYPRFEGLTHPLAYTRLVLARLSFRSRRSDLVSIDDIDLLARRTTDRDFADDVVLREVVLAALAQLPPRQRACVYLRFLMGLDDQKIARVLDCRAVTVRAQTSRALRTLKPILVEQGVST